MITHFTVQSSVTPECVPLFTAKNANNVDNDKNNENNESNEK